tara:strand:- start:465 stop:1514 length:1050 start_codon:yes stop_codon:yes gene_type:complete
MQIKRLINRDFLIWILFPLSLFYGGIVYWRNLFYNFGFFISRRLPCYVISVGNITAGGTGKTPMVMFLAKLIKKYGKNVAILSRGYGRKTKGTILVTDGHSKLKSNFKDYGDEPYLLANTLKGIPLVVDNDRFRGGMYLIKKFKPQIIILDDGFQHRSLERDLDLVLVSTIDRINDHKLLPYGILREPWENISRADAIIVTKTNLKKPKSFLYRKLSKTNKILINSKMESVISPLKKHLNSENRCLKNKRVFIFSAIGDPASFILSIEKLGAIICGKKEFNDHYIYSQTDLINIDRVASKTDAEYLITTEKDWVKIENFKSKYNIIVLEAKISLSNEVQLEKLLLPFIS